MKGKSRELQAEMLVKKFAYMHKVDECVNTKTGIEKVSQYTTWKL